MIAHQESFQFAYYAPDTHREPATDIVAQLLKAFESKGFVPNTEVEITAKTTQGSVQVAPRLQLQFISTNQQWNLAFEEQRLNLRQLNVPNASMGNAEDFCIEAKEIFRLLFAAIPFTGDRMAFVSKGLLAEMAADKLDAAIMRVFNPIPFYAENRPHQWTTKMFSRLKKEIDGKVETFNVITDINRVQGTMPGDVSPISFDRIQVVTDINTYQGNKEPRFHIEDFDWFLKEAVEATARIVDEIEGKLHE